MEIPEQWKTILETLTKATAENRVTWSEISKDTVAITFDQNTVEISDGVDPVSNMPFVSVGLRDSRGLLIDNFWLNEPDSGYEFLLALHKAGMRKARRVDETLARLNVELQKPQIGKQPSGSDAAGKIPSLLLGRWDHQWDPGLRSKAIVTISEDGSYVAQTGPVPMQFRLEKAVYSEEKREVRFDLIKVTDGKKDSTQILRVESPNLLNGYVEGTPGNPRRYTRV